MLFWKKGWDGWDKRYIWGLFYAKVAISESDLTPGYLKRFHVPPRLLACSRIQYERCGQVCWIWYAVPIPIHIERTRLYYVREWWRVRKKERERERGENLMWMMWIDCQPERPPPTIITSKWSISIFRLSSLCCLSLCSPIIWLTRSLGVCDSIFASWNTLWVLFKALITITYKVTMTYKSTSRLLVEAFLEQRKIFLRGKSLSLWQHKEIDVCVLY